MAGEAVRLRREPPPFRRAVVARTEHLSPFLVRVTLAGPELAGLDPGLPAASVRLLLPQPGAPEVAVPVWNGNEFLHADGSRPVLRTLTPLRAVGDELEVAVVLHGPAPLSTWAATAAAGSAVAVSGTGRGYEVDPAARSYLLAGDESALPALGVLLAALPAPAEVRVLVEVRDRSAEVDLPAHPGAQVHWLAARPGTPPGDAMVRAVEAADLDPSVRVWAAGEAAAVQRLRRHLFDERHLPRTQAVVRGYWKQGRAGDGGP